MLAPRAAGERERERGEEVLSVRSGSAIDVAGVQARATRGGCWRRQYLPARVVGGMGDGRRASASSGVRGVRAWTQGRSAQDVVTGRAGVYRPGCGALRGDVCNMRVRPRSSRRWIESNRAGVGVGGADARRVPGTSSARRRGGCAMVTRTGGLECRHDLRLRVAAAVGEVHAGWDWGDGHGHGPRVDGDAVRTRVTCARFGGEEAFGRLGELVESAALLSTMSMASHSRSKGRNETIHLLLCSRSLPVLGATRAGGIRAVDRSCSPALSILASLRSHFRSLTPSFVASSPAHDPQAARVIDVPLMQYIQHVLDAVIHYLQQVTASNGGINAFPRVFSPHQNRQFYAHFYDYFDY
ncbi:hypothetical protein B0H16DRAFT_1459893 [Mycena metata]|uniref:Uncharacterized protein n=1 Tax=Mycena metata TaxID=1033252 RepID=A0AAD7IX52_9AGAR|nr:hypothetical protein B0H16DRAFT_1459893 [Mycena metata]